MIRTAMATMIQFRLSMDSLPYKAPPSGEDGTPIPKEKGRHREAAGNSGDGGSPRKARTTSREHKMRKPETKSFV